MIAIHADGQNYQVIVVFTDRSGLLMGLLDTDHWIPFEETMPGSAAFDFYEILTN